MPRKRSQSGEAQRRRQVRYRERLAVDGRPEASAVDIAVAAAVASYVGEAAVEAGLETRALRRILRDAMRWLEKAGYDAQEARAVLIRRIGRFGHVLPSDLEDGSPADA